MKARKLAMAFVLAAACAMFAADSACWLFQDDDTPPCVALHAAACTEDWCDNEVKHACEKGFRLDPGSGSGTACDVQTCMAETGCRLRTWPDADSRAKTLYACVARAMGKDDIANCFHAQFANEDCYGTLSMKDATHVPPFPSSVPAIALLAGDDLACVTCAANAGCGAMEGCLGEAGAPTVDSCMDYRACLATCRDANARDSVEYTRCVRSECNTAAHARGRAGFLRYRTCMAANCAECGG
jgi:hypothetical protein